MIELILNFKRSMENKWLVILAAACGISLIFLNLSAIPITIPTLQKEFGFSEESVEWVVNGYFLALTIFILPMGRLADLFGVRTIYCLGLAANAIGSIICALSLSPFWLIFGRIIQGFGVGSMFPPFGTHLMSAFPKEERGKAIGLNVGIGSVFLILGPLLGGFLTEYLSWRILFCINIPIALIGFFVIFFKEKHSPRNKEMRFDYLGASLLALSMGSITMALMQGVKWGWGSPPILILFFSSILLGTLFFMNAKRQKEPLIDLNFFKNTLFTASTFCGSLMQFISIISVFWVLYFQAELGFSPTKAGVAILIINFPAIVIAPFSGYLADSLGFKVPIVLGFSLIVFAGSWLLLMGPILTLFALTPSLLAFGIGYALIMSPSLVGALTEISEEKRSSAAALSLGFRQLSPTLGMAMMSAVYFSSLHYFGTHLMAYKMINLVLSALALFGVVAASYTIQVQAEKVTKN